MLWALNSWHKHMLLLQATTTDTSILVTVAQAWLTCAQTLRFTFFAFFFYDCDVFPHPWNERGGEKKDQNFKIIIHSNVLTSDINQSKLKHAFKTEQFF